MTRKNTIRMSIYSTIALTFSIVILKLYFLPFRDSYNELRNIINSSPFNAISMSYSEQSYINNVMSSWDKDVVEFSGKDMGTLLKKHGFDDNTEGLRQFYTHEMPSLSLVDNQRNIKEARVGLDLHLLVQASPDHRIYYKKGFTYLKWPTDTRVEIYEDTENGMKKTVYRKPYTPTKTSQKLNSAHSR